MVTASYKGKFMRHYVKVAAVRGLGQRRFTWNVSDLDLVPLLQHS